LLGLDSSKGMVGRARREQPEIDVRLEDGRNTSIADGAAGAVILFAVLTTVPDDGEQQTLISECRRILHAGGVLYVSDLLLGDDSRNIERYDQFAARFGAYGTFELPDGGVMRHHAESWVRSLLADFEPLHYERLVVKTMNRNRAQAFQFIGRNSS